MTPEGVIFLLFPFFPRQKNLEKKRGLCYTI